MVMERIEVCEFVAVRGGGQQGSLGCPESIVNWTDESGISAQLKDWWQAACFDVFDEDARGSEASPRR